MNTQVTSKLARLAQRLSSLGRRHQEFTDRIAAVKKREKPCEFALRRLQKEKARIQREMQQYEQVLRALAQRLPNAASVTA